MTKMRLDEAIDRLKEDLSSDPKLLEVCLAIVQSIADQDSGQFRRVTYRMIAQLGKTQKTDDAMSALVYLCGDRLPFFIPRHSFVDDEHDELIDDDVMHDLMAGKPYHDSYGDVFENPLNRVRTHFELSPLAQKLARGAASR